MFVALIFAPLAAGAAPQPAPVKPVCQTTGRTLIKEGQRGRARPLASEPPAKQYFTVLRTEDGCQKPVLVSDRSRGHAPR